MWDAYVCKMQDEMERIHLQAWLNMAAKGQKKKGRETVTAFPKFTDFYKKRNTDFENPSIDELDEIFRNG